MIDQSILPRYPYFVPFFSSWLPENLGFFGITPSFGLFLWNFFSLISFGNQVIAQKLVIAHSLFACFAMYFFLGNHITKSRLSRFIGSILFAYSPVAAYQWVTPIMWGYSLLPLVLSYLFNILDKEKTRRRDPILLAIVSLFAVSYLPHILMFLPIIIFVFLLVYLISERNKIRYLLHCLKYFIIFAAIYIALSWSFLLGIYSFYVSGSLTAIKFPASFFLYDNFTLFNALRLTGDPWRTYFFGDNPAGFVLLILAFLALPLAIDREIRRKTIGFSILSAILILFGLVVKYEFEWFTWLLNNFSIIAVLRDPMKILLILSLAYSILIAVTIDGLKLRLRLFSLIIRIENVITKKGRSFRFSLNHLKPIIVDVFLAALILIPYFAYVPIYDNNVFSIQGYDWAPQPPSYDTMIKWLDNQREAGSFRYLVLPLTPSGPTSRLTFEYPNFFSAASGYASPSTLSYVIFVFDTLTLNKTFTLGNLIAPANVKYLLVPLDAISVGNDRGSVEGPPRRSETFLAGNPISFFNILSSQKDLELIYSESNFTVFRNNEFIPHVSVFSDVLYVIGDRDTLTSLASFPNFDIRCTLIIFGEQDPNENLFEVSNGKIFLNRDFDDLLLSFLVNTNGIDLWNFGKSPPTETLEQTSIEGWETPIGRYSSKYLNGGSFFTYGGDNNYIETTTNATIDIPFKSNSSYTSELWLRILYSPFSQGTLSFSLDKAPLDMLIQPKTEKFVGFKWVKLGSFSLPKGERTLTINSQGGYNALDELVVVPSNTMTEVKARIADLLDGNRITFLYDAQAPFFEQETMVRRTNISNSDLTTGWTTWSFPSSYPYPTIETDTVNKMEGTGSIKWTVNSTDGGERHLAYEFDTPQNWMNEDLLEIWMYGTGVPRAYAVQISDALGNWRNLVYPSTTHSGWKLLTLPLSEYVEQSRTPPDLSAIKRISIIFFPQAGDTSMEILRFDDVNLVKVLNHLFRSSIYIPKENYYSIALKQPSKLNETSIKLKIDNDTIPVRGVEPDWYESEQSFLSSGTHEISITLPAEVELNEIAIHTAPKLSDLFKNSSNYVEYSAQKVSETEYRVKFYSDDPVFVVLGESYHPEWRAYIDGRELQHFPSFSLTNGFYANGSGNQEIVIKFELQTAYLTFVSFRVSILALSLIILLYDFIYEFIGTPKYRKTRARLLRRSCILLREGRQNEYKRIL